MITAAVVVVLVKMRFLIFFSFTYALGVQAIVDTCEIPIAVDTREIGTTTPRSM